MSSTLNSIMLTIKNALDASSNITNPNAILDAVGELERFPMTMTQLQDTRIAQLLQTVRHKVDPPLQKRIRFIIKAWQKLLLPEYSAQPVIPVKCGGAGSLPVSASLPQLTDRQKSNGTCLPPRPIAPPTTIGSSGPVSNQSDVSQLNATPGLLKRTRSSPIKSNDHFTEAHRNSVVEQHSPTPRKRPKVVCPPDTRAQRSPTKPSSHSPLLNGGQHLPSINSYSLVTSESPVIPSSQASTKQVISKKVDKSSAPCPRLAKVKSTAELVQSASDCLDSATVCRILTNRISKEEDPPRQPSQRARHKRGTATNLAPNRINRQSSRSAVSSERDTVPIPHSSQKQVAPVSPEDLPISRLASLRLPNSASGTPLRKTDVPIPSDSCLSVQPDSVPPPPPPPLVLPSGDTDSDHQKSSRHIRGKKRHKHHKHKQHRSADTGVDTIVPPVTNHLDNWPVLPPLPSTIQWNSPGPEAVDVPKPVTVDSLLFGTLPGVNCTVDDDGNPRPLTQLYSLTVDDRYLHILPWIDVHGAQRQFFPPDGESLDELTTLPEPW